MTKKKTYQVLLVIIMAILIYVPGINNITGFVEFDRASENRTFRDSISINIKQLDKFPGEFEEYLNDNFSFRTPLLNLYHKIKFSQFKISPHPGKTIIGLNDWYYMAYKEREIYEGKHQFSDKELKQLKNEWTFRKKYLDSLNIEFYWLICPFKHNIYPEHLPFYILPGKEKRVDQLKSYLADDFPNLIVDPSNELIEAKDSQKVFYQLDNHWNYRAGYVTAKKLLKHIQKDFPDETIPDIADVKWKDTIIQNGYHYRVLGIPELTENDVEPIILNEQSFETDKYGFIAPKGFAYPWAYEYRYLNEGLVSGKKILIIRDSFGNQVLPFLKESFRESVYIFDAWQYKLNKDIIEVVKPDIVLFMGLETHLDALLDDIK